MIIATQPTTHLLSAVDELAKPFGAPIQRHLQLMIEEAFEQEDAMFFLRVSTKEMARCASAQMEAWHHLIERFNMSTLAVRELNRLLEPYGFQYLAFCGCGDCIVPATEEAEQNIQFYEASAMKGLPQEVSIVSEAQADHRMNGAVCSFARASRHALTC